jgi:cytoskeletal protein CcmA (bactofilin family)
MWRRIPLSELQALVAHKSVPPPRASQSDRGAAVSVLGNDLKIFADGLTITCQGILQVDCEIEADVEAAEVIVDRKGRVKGKVAADRVIVRGGVSGVIRANRVSLEPPAEVHGDIYHTALAIDEGARFLGRSYPAPEGAIADSPGEGTGTEQHTSAGIG